MLQLSFPSELAVVPELAEGLLHATDETAGDPVTRLLSTRTVGQGVPPVVVCWHLHRPDLVIGPSGFPIRRAGKHGRPRLQSRGAKTLIGHPAARVRLARCRARSGTERSPSGWSTSRQALLGDRVEDDPLPRGPPRATARGSSTGAICPKDDKEVPNDEIVKGYEVAEGKYVVLEQGRDQGRRGRPRQGDRRRGVRRRRRDRPGLLREDLLRRAPRDDAEPTGCCTRRCAGAGGPGSAASASTIASTSSRCGRSTRCSRCTRCASTTRSSAATTSTCRPRGRKPPSARSRWRSKLVEIARAATFDPSDYEDTYREAVLDADQAQGRGQGDRPARRRGARARRRPDGRAGGEPVGRADGARAVERLAQLRARQRAGAAGQRRARPRLPLPPAPRQGQAPHRAAPLLLGGGRRGRLGGDRPRLRPRTASRSSSPTRSSRPSSRGRRRTIDIESFVDARRDRPDLLRPPLLPGPRRRERGHDARLPAAGRGDGARRSGWRSGGS